MAKVTYACTDCGKERTAYEYAFTKPRDKYRCKSCASKHRALEEGNSTATRICIDCGKERTAPPSRFTTPIGQYRCKSCAAKFIKPKHPIVYKCVDCGKERISTKSFLKHCTNGVYLCKQCDGKRRIKRVTYACIDCGKEHTATPCEFTQPPDSYRCLTCATSKWMKENSKRINESRGFDGSSRGVVTYKCIECGKERTAMRKSFNKSEEEYICVSCFSKNQANLPERIGILIERNKKRSLDPVWQAMMLERNQRMAQDPILRENIIIKSSGQGFWYGHPILHNTKTIYCELWKDVNPRVHAFFENKCCVCGAPETTRSHVGHHVFYVKNACCWKSENGIYYTNLNVKTHRQNDYCIGENPNYFVILCQSCHGKTNGSFENRKKWADYFKNMIDEEYNGKCYLTKEEYEIFKSNK